MLTLPAKLCAAPRRQRVGRIVPGEMPYVGHRVDPVGGVADFRGHRADILDRVIEREIGALDHRRTGGDAAHHQVRRQDREGDRGPVVGFVAFGDLVPVVRPDPQKVLPGAEARRVLKPPPKVCEVPAPCPLLTL